MASESTRRGFLKLSLAGAVGAALGSRPASGAAPAGLADRLGVCSWSLQPTSADDFFTKLAATGLTRTQIALGPIRENAKGAWTDFAGRCARRGVTCVSGVMESVGGITPPSTASSGPAAWCPT